MKTIITYFLTMVLATIFVSALAFSYPVSHEEEAIDDIPFDTETIHQDWLAQSMDFYFDDEPFVNDIPFNTKCIAGNGIYKKAISINYVMEPEPEINDIPFNTGLVSEEYKYQQALKQVFLFEDEDIIDDFPFNTQIITTTNQLP